MSCRLGKMYSLLAYVDSKGQQSQDLMALIRQLRPDIQQAIGVIEYDLVAYSGQAMPSYLHHSSRMPVIVQNKQNPTPYFQGDAIALIRQYMAEYPATQPAQPPQNQQYQQPQYQQPQYQQNQQYQQPQYQQNQQYQQPQPQHQQPQYQPPQPQPRHLDPLGSTHMVVAATGSNRRSVMSDDLFNCRVVNRAGCTGKNQKHVTKEEIAAYTAMRDQAISSKRR